jgi:hypothetical protein
MRQNGDFARRWTAAALAGFLAVAGARAADTFSASTAQGYGRMLFVLAPLTHVQTEVVGLVLTLSFDRKTQISPSAIAGAMPGYIAVARQDANGQSFRFVLTQPVRLHTSTSADRIAVDLIPASYSGTPPDLPPPPPPPVTAVDVAKLVPLPVRAGAYHNFTRIVFDWTRNVPYAVFPGSGTLTVRFEAEAKPDFSALTREAPPWVKAAGWRIENKGTVVELQTDADSGFHDFRDGNHVVIDVLAPKTDADAYKPPGDAKPSVTALTPSDKKAAAVTTAQAQAVMQAAAKLNGTVQPPQKATGAPQQLQASVVKQATPPAPQPTLQQQPAPTQPASANPPATQTAQPVTPDTQAADGKLTHEGAVLVFQGAARRGAAVFMRGLTAWIVLQNAGPFDTARLKSVLGDFPEEVDAETGNGLSILRITLKQPEEIAALADGSNLKVVIAPQVTSNVIAIGFARNQDDAIHSSLSTLLPGASKAITLVDPVAGDELIVIPGLAGRAMMGEHVYVEFSALDTASGMVILPFVDDLSVAIDAPRVTIARPGGLSLTSSAMPVASSPQALAHGSDGPCFLDFANWKRITGGSFLATERRLRMAAAHLKPEDSNHARLALTRFYLANGFDAEALGLVALMQSSDPALQSDMQLQTIRAAAEYEMGRYRDARNDLSGAQFDADRHAALWRGLIEAAQEDWADAHADLDRAGPVLNRYQPEMQTRARLSNAEAALALGRLEIADAQLARLPSGMNANLSMEAQLARARLYAAENRQAAANKLFAAVEQGGNEKLEAEALYYRVSAALAAGTMPTSNAVNALERLRFRWRGDLLELRTLRKLASLYFGEKKWREGLQTLRIATQFFPNEDTANQAQDDMRAAFVELFLKGKADQLPPVDALALFYDFIDLTPIGPDGDEMIRRMADRLVAVDLLGPAEDLLRYQVNKRLDGVARAQVATKLAAIQLMDHKPQDALESLRSTQISTLPDDVNHQRLLLEARGLAAEKQWDQALDLIAVDQAPDTVGLRADIYWESGNWAQAGQKAEDALGTRWSDGTPLTQDERQEAMRAAVAYSLANDEPSLERIRDHFMAKMKGTPNASAFAVVTQRIDMHGMAFRDAAAQVAQVDTLTSFMKSLRVQ